MPRDNPLDIREPSVARSMTLLAVGATVGLALAGYSLFTAKGTRTRNVPPEAVAMVNQRPILRNDFMTQTQTQFGSAFSTTTGEQRRQVLNDMINEELAVQRGLEIDLPSYDPDVRNALVAGVELEVGADALAQQPSTQEMRDYYEAHKDRYSSPGVMRLRDLVVPVDATHSLSAARSVATAAILALRTGRSVDEVVATLSIADSGRFMHAGNVDTGDIFQFAVRAKVDDQLYRAIIGLKEGDVSEPVVEPDGVHVVAMIMHRFPVPRAYEDVSNQVWSDLRKDAREKVLASNLAYLRSRADIAVAPASTR